MIRRMYLLALLGIASLALGAAPAAEEAITASPFAIRGIKGLWWEGLEKYRLALPWVAQHRLNFLMLCYSSFDASGKNWRQEYKPEELAGFRELSAKAAESGVNLCLSFNPGIWSKPPLKYSSEDDYRLALAKVKAAHETGIRWIALCLDDINRALEPDDVARFGTLQVAQVYFINRLWGDMKALEPRPTLIFCPSAYTTQDAEKHLDYIQTIGSIDSGVLMFWTGPQVCSPTITAADARKFAGWIKRKPFVWDNYPVNDMFPWRPLLAPVKGRSADLASEVSGFMSNPMKQWHISTIPLATVAAYLNDPLHYDGDMAMEAAIREHPFEQGPGIRGLVSLYGTSFLGEKNYPPDPSKAPPADWPSLTVRCQRLVAELERSNELRAVWEDVRPTLQADLAALRGRGRGPAKGKN
jgi:hyaluronoglucosaminidase